MGTAVELSKALCIKSYGGELLASKAVSEALIRSKKGGDDISVQRLGEMTINNLRKIELIQLIPRELSMRLFPQRSMINKFIEKKRKRESMLASILNNDE